MAEITQAINQRGYEIVRARIAAILALELPNQATLIGDNYLNASIWVQRILPFSFEDSPFVNVMFVENDYQFMTNAEQDYIANFVIEVGISSGKNGLDHQDKSAAIKTQRLMGVIQGILMNQKYYTLGFDPSDSFVGRRTINSMGMTNPSTDSNSAKSLQRGAISLSVHLSDINNFDELDYLRDLCTTITLGVTKDGYIWCDRGNNFKYTEDGQIKLTESGEIKTEENGG